MSRNQFDPSAWVATLTQEQKDFIASRYTAGRGDGFKAGEAKADKAFRLNRILIPLAVFGVPAGMLIQRYLIVLG